jgi:hypothetical protein
LDTDVVGFAALNPSCGLQDINLTEYVDPP